MTGVVTNRSRLKMTPDKRIGTEIVMNTKPKNEISCISSWDTRTHNRKINNPYSKVELNSIIQRYLVYATCIRNEAKGNLSLSNHVQESNNKKRVPILVFQKPKKL